MIDIKTENRDRRKEKMIDIQTDEQTEIKDRITQQKYIHTWELEPLVPR